MFNFLVGTNLKAKSWLPEEKSELNHTAKKLTTKFKIFPFFQR